MIQLERYISVLSTMDNAVPSVLAALLSWATMYILLCIICSTRSYEWHVRLVTMAHATLVTVLSWICSYNYGPWPFTDAGGVNTTFQETIVTISLGYFLFDLSWCLYFKTEGPAMMFHHVLSVTGLSVTLYRGLYGCEIVAVIFGSEITNPLLQLRWFLKDSGRYNTWLGELVDICFMALFGIMRLGIGSYLLYTYMTNPRTDYVGRTGGLLIYSVGWIFWVSIIQFAIKKYSKKWQERKTKLSAFSQKDLADSSCDGCRDSASAACVQRVNKVIQDITKSTVDSNTVEAIKSLSSVNQDSIKRSVNT